MNYFLDLLFDLRENPVYKPFLSKCKIKNKTNQNIN